MNQFIEWLSRLFGSWKFWVVVAPWEIGVRIRFGKMAATLKPGPHWRIPLLDEITLVSTRLRIGTTPPVTLPGTTPSKVRTVSAVVGYRISDPALSMMRYAHPEGAVLSAVQAELTLHNTNGKCLTACREVFAGSGVEIDFVRYCEDVEVRALRLMQIGSTLWSGAESGPSVNGTTRI